MTFVIVLAIIAVIAPILTIVLKHKPIASSTIVLICGLIVLIWKSIEFTYYFINDTGSVPIEFSHLSYFILGVTMVFSIKPLYMFSGFMSLISGIGFLVGGFVSPENMSSATRGFPVALSVASHTLLLIAGLLLLFNVRRYKKSDFAFTALGLIACIVFAFLASKGIIYPNDQGSVNNAIIVKIANGDILEYVMAADKIENWMRILVPIAIFILAVLVMWLVYAINHRLYKTRAKKLGVDVSELPLTPVGLFPLIKRARHPRPNIQYSLTKKLEC